MTHPVTLPKEAKDGGAFGFVRKGYNPIEVHQLKTSDVDGTTVYGRDDENIGSIDSLKVGEGDKITDAVIAVGGFLGMGVHSVLIPFSELTVLREADGSDLRVYLDTTKDKLKAMPHHAD